MCKHIAIPEVDEMKSHGRCGGLHSVYIFIRSSFLSGTPGGHFDKHLAFYQTLQSLRRHVPLAILWKPHREFNS